MGATTLSKKKLAFRPQIRSRHDTHDGLRTLLSRFKKRSVIRFGSSTELNDGIDRIELNTVQAIRNSANKYLMKECFINAGVKTADVISGKDNTAETVLEFFKDYPVVAKHIFGSRGRGNYLLKTKEELTAWLSSHSDLNNYIFEKFYNYNREYRLHVNEQGCFYTCRKMLKSDTPEDKRWFRNDSNSVWIVEENEQFDKPSNWDAVIEESVKALKSVGLDFGAVDLRIQSATDSKGRTRENPEFIVVEINSAPSFGEGTLAKYLEEIPKMLQLKFEQTV